MKETPDAVMRMIGESLDAAHDVLLDRYKAWLVAAPMPDQKARVWHLCISAQDFMEPSELALYTALMKHQRLG
jgi:hypothetical protein